MEFNQFLLSLKNDIAHNHFRVFYDPKKDTANIKEILIGIGNQESGGMVISNKWNRSKGNSVSQILYQDSDEIVAAISQQINDTDLQTLHFFIEDLSPDTCFSFVLLFAFIRGVRKETLPLRWLEYVNKWELGDVKTTGEPVKSWGCLLNALSHEYFEYKNEQYDQHKIQHGFNMCLKFTLEALLSGQDPANLTYLPHSEGFLKATSALQVEKLEYQQLVMNSEKVQLLLPIKDSTKKVLVDALITTELNVLGTLKNFARNDRDTPSMGNGFGLLALHRPSLKGTGDDVVISVDPAASTHLTKLWDSLESLEDEKWQSARPNDRPREGYTVNQPWFNGNGSYTLLAAPRKIYGASSEQFGSKLSWKDVLDKLWENYHPLKNLKVHDYLSDGSWSAPSNLIDCTPVNSQSAKRFMGIKWSDSNQELSLTITPTMKRYLVACLQGNGKAPGILDLPNEKTFDYVELPGGFALVHLNGIVFFDDWSKQHSEIQLYKNEFDHLLKRYEAIDEYQSYIQTEMQEILDLFKDRRMLRKKLVSLSERLAKIKIELRQNLFATMPASKEYYIQFFRETVEKRWGLNTQLNELYETVNEVENTINSIVETRSNRVLRGISIYGFPIALFSSLFQGPLQDLFIHSKFNWQALLSFAIFTPISIWILSKLVDRE
ncbi:MULTISPECIES: hypothetical protein [unclassified Bacillus (in: firmicutes)]|uniref:hypothetical protein n=1 Tax=unclassified Bacillus (in: firmicutes) TaxID=185979 RepID=UPI0008EAB930|nr:MULTISPECIES: hypothetical protein [unclassified Bacillus (in: firmicutes)]SFB09115.1 hypothetical protein SAMN02799634_105228 [Bacillus sp. UNCCL13]SFQ86835.1 hypothetical protein SAMN04488577_2893 [Bacillus sp. cl95]